MKWEFLGVQELQQGNGGKGYIYKVAMWRTPVPGGWLLMSINAKSSDPQPLQSFFPDPDHLWTGSQTPAEAGYLLRAASAVGSLSSQMLLRASNHPDFDAEENRAGENFDFDER